MFDISKVDNNFEIKTQIDKKDIKFYKIDEVPFRIYGVFRENGKYRRMPESVAKNVSEGVYTLHSNTAGGRVRFVTDSTYIAIHAKMDGLGKMPHFALTGSIGFDLYLLTSILKSSYISANGCFPTFPLANISKSLSFNISCNFSSPYLSLNFSESS